MLDPNTGNAFVNKIKDRPEWNRSMGKMVAEMGDIRAK
jgi:hypothetical protein